ncbi:MAG: cytochrome c peroxidase [Myxococcales bacterium]
MLLRRIVLLLLVLAACEGASHGELLDANQTVEAGADDASATDAALPLITTEQWATLQTLRYDDGAPPPDPSNRFADDPAAARFGRTLFFDPSLSGPLIEADNDGGPATLGKQGEAGRVSCAGCHVPSAHFVDTRSPHRSISLAAQWTRRRTPTLLEIAFAPLYNWDGRRDSIWGQALGVMESENEFNSGRLFVAQQIFRLHRASYEALFGPLPPLDDSERFPALASEQAGCAEKLTSSGSVHICHGRPGDGDEYDGMSAGDRDLVTRVAVNVAKAMAAYVRQLRCGPGRFDSWLAGADDALDASEQRGAALFVGRGQCVSCHSGPRFTDGQFHNAGLAPALVAVAFVDADDRGAAEGLAQLLADPLNTRGAYSDGERAVLPATLGPNLEGGFRTPTLRCIAEQPSFMHTGQLKTLEQVVAFHDRGGDGMGNYPGQNELKPLGLSEGEQSDLAAFLRTLQGAGPESALLVP